jgi:hypothetical protein
MSPIDLNVFDRTQGSPHLQSPGSWGNDRTYVTLPPPSGTRSATTAPEVCPNLSIGIFEVLTVRTTVTAVRLSVPVRVKGPPYLQNDTIITIKLVLPDTTHVSFIIMLKCSLQEQYVSTQLRGHHQAGIVMKLKMAARKQLVYLWGPVRFI